MTNSASEMTVDKGHGTLIRGFIDSLCRVYRGPREMVSMLTTAFLAGGHVLLQDIPGVGKTTLARALARSIDGTFRRIQCTPDLMPSDVTGISIYDDVAREFKFHPGPAFCDILLADELNRTPPRTQSALLEAMNENQVSIDGIARPLSEIFFCMATQNPQEQVGTYPLPESQSDRFLLCFALGYPEHDAEIGLLESDGADAQLEQMQTVLNRDQVLSLRQQVRAVSVSTEVRHYLLSIIEATRAHNAIMTGASPRAALGLQRAAQARALIDDREFVVPDDVQTLVEACLGHRMVLRSGQSPAAVLNDIIDQIPVPR
jgi:MoxR-like ATPase